jgi:hypothetical protein
MIDLKLFSANEFDSKGAERMAVEERSQHFVEVLTGHERILARHGRIQ